MASDANIAASTPATPNCSVIHVKPRRIDWSAVDWLDGVAEMPPDERGVYDTIINLIYARGDEDGGIEITEHDLAIRCCCHWRQLRRILEALMTRGKVWQEGRRMYAKRCADALHVARNRVAQAQQNANTRWHGYNKIKDVDDAAAYSPSNARARSSATNNQQPSFLSSEEDKGPSRFSGLVAIWNDAGLPRVLKVNEERLKKLKLRFDDDLSGKLGQWTAFVERIRASRFLMGENDRKWMIDFDWALEPRNFTRIIEGKYDNHDKASGPAFSRTRAPTSPAPKVQDDEG